MNSRRVFKFLALASFLNILPLLLYPLGGDTIFQHILLKCFASQFWQGDIYPRWCFEAQGGLGAPFFLFYPPLAFFIGTFFYPLAHLGFGLDGAYTLSLYAATLVTGFTCYLWLKDIVSPTRALLAAIIFLFIPYRMEVLLFRSAYAEAWFIALLPLLFKYVRQLALGHKDVWAPLALVLGLMLLCHLPGSFAAIIASGLYLVIFTGTNTAPWWRYALSLALGIAFAGFYLLPAMYFKPYVFAEQMVSGTIPWANDFMTAANIKTQATAVFGALLTLLALIVLFAVMVLKRRRLPDASSRELLSFILLFAVGTLLLFPAGKFFYQSIGPLAQIAFPWRMQLVFLPCAAWVAAMWMEYLLPARKTAKADFGLLLGLLVLVGFLLTGVGKDDANAGKRLDYGIVTTPEYRSRWTSADFGSERYLLQHAQAEKPRALGTRGAGTAEVTAWRWSGIALNTTGRRGAQISIDHSYFPIWSAQDEEGNPLDLRAEEGPGLMLLDIPAGRHNILLRYSIYSDAGFLRASLWASLLTGLWLVGVTCRSKKTKF